MTLPSIVDGPPAGSYQEASAGWLLSSESPEWLYKPASGVYFHSPSESLWKARPEMAFDGTPTKHFIRLDDLSRQASPSSSADSKRCGGISPRSRRCYELAIVALSFGGADGTTLLRVSFISWKLRSGRARKFEEMQRDLATCCEQAMEGSCMTPPRTSPALPEVTPEVASEEGLWPGFARMMGLSLSCSRPSIACEARPYSSQPSPMRRMSSPAVNTRQLDMHCEEADDKENAKPSREHSATGMHTQNRSAYPELVRARSADPESTTILSPTPLSLTTTALARHDLVPQLQRSVSRRELVKDGSLSRREIEVGRIGEAKLPPSHSSLAAVHLEREIGWRHHVRKLPNRPATIE